MDPAIDVSWIWRELKLRWLTAFCTAVAMSIWSPSEDELPSRACLSHINSLLCGTERRDRTMLTCCPAATEVFGSITSILRVSFGVSEAEWLFTEAESIIPLVIVVLHSYSNSLDGLGKMESSRRGKPDVLSTSPSPLSVSRYHNSGLAPDLRLASSQRHDTLASVETRESVRYLALHGFDII